MSASRTNPVQRLHAWLRRCSHWVPVLALWHGAAQGSDSGLSASQIKIGFLYNFAVLTTWPAAVGPTLNLCVAGRNPFGADLDLLTGKRVGARTLNVNRLAGTDALSGCQILFIPASETALLSRWIGAVDGAPTLTIGESVGAAHVGVMLNLNQTQDRLTFEANLGAAHRAGLTLSARLLRLASEVLR